MKIALFLLLAVAAKASHWVIQATPQERALKVAEWRAVNPSGVAIGFNGRSMLPVLQPGDTLLQDAYVGQRLEKEIILINEGEGRRMIEHYVYDETATHVFVTGLNNRKSDGWYPKTAVAAVLVGVIRG